MPHVLPEGYTWLTYTPGSGIGSAFAPIASLTPDAGGAGHLKKLDDLLADLDAGVLANYMHLKLVGKLKNGVDVSEHPPAAVCPGESYTVQVVNALMQSPHWKEMAIVITWDDWGGFYDHVPPPVHRCDGTPDVFNPGFRLPAMILSPYAKQGVVLHTVTEQASVPKLVTELLGGPRCTRCTGSRATRARAR